MTERDFEAIDALIQDIWMYLDENDPSVSDMYALLDAFNKLNDEHLDFFAYGPRKASENLESC